jgi:hypothetical protein
MSTRIEELKEECQLLREEDMYVQGMQGEEDEEMIQ